MFTQCGNTVWFSWMAAIERGWTSGGFVSSGEMQEKLENESES